MTNKQKKRLDIPTVAPQWVHLTHWLFAPHSQPPILLSALEEKPLAAVRQHLALAAVCEKYSNTVCRKCRSEAQMTTGTHPDVIDLTQEDAIGVDEIRALVSQLSRTATGPRRLVLVPYAEKVSLPAANALLKTLEEHADSTRILLTTRWPQRLLSTIRSRCVAVHLTLPVTRSLVGDTVGKLDLVERLAKKSDDALDEQGIEAIAAGLSEMLREQGPTPELRRAFARLRDYSLISSRQGNVKLAQDLLYASLP